MDDSALRRRISEIEAGLEAARFEVAVKEAVLAELRACLPTPKAAVAPAKLAGSAPPATPGTFSGSLAARAAHVLRHEGKAMRASDIARRVEEAGFHPTGKTSTLALVLSAMRRRKDIFLRVGRGRYRLAEKVGADEPSAGKEDTG